MFKKLVPVLALALLAGPVFAADAPASTPSDQSSTASSKHHNKKSHSSKHKKSTTTDSSSNAPAK